MGTISRILPNDRFLCRSCFHVHHNRDRLFGLQAVCSYCYDGSPDPEADYSPQDEDQEPLF